MLLLPLIQNLNPYCCRCRCWCWYRGWCQSCECFAAFNCQSNDVYWGRKKGEGANQPHLENLHLPKANAKYISKLTTNTFWHFEIWDKYKQTTSTEGVEGANQLHLENLHLGKAFKCKNWGYFWLCPKGFGGSIQKLQKWHWEEKGARLPTSLIWKICTCQCPMFCLLPDPIMTTRSLGTPSEHDFEVEALDFHFCPPYGSWSCVTLIIIYDYNHHYASMVSNQKDDRKALRRCWQII